MIVALNLLCLYAAATLQTGRLVMFFSSAFFVYILSCEGAYLSAIVSYLATCLLAYLILPNKLTVLPYALLLGHYGIFKTWLDTMLADKVLRFIIKLMYCNLFFFIAGLCAYYIYGLSFDISVLEYDLPIYVLVLAMEAAFIAFDLIYGMTQRLYQSRLRPYMTSKR